MMRHPATLKIGHGEANSGAMIQIRARSGFRSRAFCCAHVPGGAA
jgi:hypothetical protein